MSFNYVLQLNLVIRMHFIQLGPRNKRLHILQLPGLQKNLVGTEYIAHVQWDKLKGHLCAQS